MKPLISMLTLGILMICCKEQNTSAASALKPDSESLVVAARVPDSWIQKRVKSAKDRLESSEAGRIVWAGMQAHGGLERWYTNGPLSFHFNYQPLGEGTQRNTFQAIDTWRNHARHFKAGDSTAQYGWNGKVAWKKAQDSTAFPYDVRFWALTPFYFTGLPFVLDGDGVNLEKLPVKSFNGVAYEAVKVTFDPGTGDAPDDYYILYFHPDTHEMKVIRYIVSYPAYFKKGEHMPEKFMELLGRQEIGGILFPEGYKTYWLNEDEGPGEYITNITLARVAFLPKLEAAFFEVPEGSQILDSL